jgi:glycosyltransferase involved in cell wall biosynthesis
VNSISNSFISSQIPEEDFLVCAGRWVPYKKFDLAIEVANGSGMNLVIMGGGPDEKKLRKVARRATVGIYFVKNPDDAEYLAIMAKARALIFPGIEDFGIVPVEAMQLGVPVIGINQGGLVDSVVDKVSGFLCADVSEMIAAVEKVKSLSRNEIRLQGEKFRFAIFSDLLQKWIDTRIEETH